MSDGNLDSSGLNRDNAAAEAVGAQELYLLRDVAQILSKASTVAEAAPALLERIGLNLDWQVGLLWTCEEGQVRCAGTWESSPGWREFTAIRRQLTFPPGPGLPDEVSTTCRIIDVKFRETPGGPSQTREAAELGLVSSRGFPAVDTLIGIVEFFQNPFRLPIPEMQPIVDVVGYQIGEFLQRIALERQLAERALNYRILTETAKEGIITVTADGIITFLNGQAGKIFGYTVEELIGRDARCLVPEHLREALKGVMERNSQGAQDRSRMLPAVGEHRHGHEIPLEVSIESYPERGENLFTFFVSDVTERNQLYEKMRQTAKLESLGVLAGGIAHDFNNLLTVILGNVSFASDVLEEANPAKPILSQAIEASEQAARLTQQMLAYAGKGRFRIEPANLSVIVRDISVLLKSSIPKHVAIRMDLDNALPAVKADVVQLRQLIMNLVINAAEAVPDERQGVVLVVTRFQVFDADEILQMFGESDLRPGGYVVLNVHDNGTGINSASLDKIYDPFFTTKFTGRGLGLAAALGIVRGHKGALKVFSSSGQGTTFKVLFPATSVRVTESEPKANKNLAGSGTVLLIDDEPGVLKTASFSLERHGYKVITANNGYLGVEEFRAWNLRLAAVILDVNMPVPSGEESLRLMQAINPHVPVILSSGYSEAEVGRRFAGNKWAGFIQKPYTASGFVEQIRTILQTEKG